MVKYDFPKYQIVLEIDEDVYFPAEDTFALIDAIHLEDNHRFVVELGSGSGIISIILAKKYPEIRFLITDISFKAVKSIRNNLKLNKIRNQIDLVCMDKLEASEHLSPDVIIWNPPYLPRDDETDNLEALEKLMLIGGNKGFEQAYNLIQYLKSHEISVMLYTIFSSTGTTENTFTHMRGEGIDIEICDEINIFFEKLYLVKVNLGEKNRK